MGQFLYRTEDLNFFYSLEKEKIQVIHSLSIDIPSESLVTISGPSGSGKSTLLSILGLIEPLQEGKIFFQDEDVSLLSEREKNQIRKFKIGFIFQQFHLIPVLSAEENVRYFLARQGLPKNEIRQRAHDALESVGLWEHRLKKPFQLSGGQKQRVAIARAIAKSPSVIIGDEPTASIDQKTGHEIMELLAKLVSEQKCSIILTTHDAMVQSFAHKNFHLQDGRIVRES